MRTPDGQQLGTPGVAASLSWGREQNCPEHNSRTAQARGERVGFKGSEVLVLSKGEGVDGVFGSVQGGGYRPRLWSCPGGGCRPDKLQLYHGRVLVTVWGVHLWVRNRIQSITNKGQKAQFWVTEMINKNTRKIPGKS